MNESEALAANIIVMEADRRRIIRILAFVLFAAFVIIGVFLMTVSVGAVAVAILVVGSGAVIAVTIASVVYVLRFDDAISNAKQRLAALHSETRA